jgi:cytochrome c553
MKKVIKWIVLVSGSLIFLTAVIALTGNILANGWLLYTYKVQAETISATSNAVWLPQGKHTVNSICTGCHGINASSIQVLTNPSLLGRIQSVNLNHVKGSTSSDVHWILNIPRSIDSEEKSVLVMPSLLFYYFKDRILPNIIAY